MLSIRPRTVSSLTLMEYEDEKILLMAGAVLVLAGCGEKGDFEKAIHTKIGQNDNRKGWLATASNFP